MGERWFEVIAAVKVKAAGEDEAITRVSDAVTMEAVPGLYPVGTFNARECEDPIEGARRRVRVDDGEGD